MTTLSTNNIEFKRATFDDIELIQELAKEIWYSHYPNIITIEQIDYMLDMMYSSRQIAKEIEDDFNWYLISYENEYVGYIAFCFDENRDIKLNKLYIKLDYHGKGLGQESLKFVLNQSKVLGAKKLYLTVNKSNTKAIKAYERFGFSKERSAVFDIGNGYVMDDYVMGIAI